MQFTMDNFVKVITWLEKEKDIIHRIALLGGEPTLHPEFIDFIEYLLPKKLGVLVFTNGMVNDKNFYTNLINVAKNNDVRSFQEFGFCVNINEPKYTNENESKLQNIFFTQLGKVSSLSFNIFEKSFDPYFLIDTISFSFILLTTSIALFVYIYTFSYFRYEPLVDRFLLFILSFVISMLFLVSSGNLIMLFLG